MGNRRPLFMANWKMHKSRFEAQEFARDFHIEEDQCDVVVCPPAPLIEAAASDAYDLGAQNVFPASEGAFTGEVSPQMLKSFDLRYVIVGHSERRELFAETDDFIREKFQACVAEDLIPVLCVGEDLACREQGQAEAFCQGQLEAVLKDSELAADLVIAYEPIWAIGSGRSADAGDAQEMLAHLRQCLRDLVGKDRAENARLLYGGSVNRDNIADYMSQKDVDGALVGGASLDAEHFAELVQKGCAQYD